MSEITSPMEVTDPDGNGRRQVLAATGRVLLVTTLLLVSYFQVPITRDGTAVGLITFVIGLVALGAAITYQVRRIIVDERPRLRAAETLGTAVPAFIVMFALVYVMLAQADAAGFSQPMTRVAALYFTVTVLSTVGFGDITAQTDATRIAVTIQMVLDLILVGVVVKVVIGASRIGMARRRATTGAEAEA